MLNWFIIREISAGQRQLDALTACNIKLYRHFVEHLEFLGIEE
jgi:hypothetical protein